MGTLAEALEPFSATRAEVAYRYPGPTGLVSRILGVIPHSFGLLVIWPPALHTTTLSVPTLFDVPAVDLGRSIDPDLRAMVAHASSRAFGCSYCTAHTAIMGSVVRGPAEAPSIDDRVRAVTTPQQLDPPARAAVEYGTAVGSMPPVDLSVATDDLAIHHDADAVEAIVLTAACMGLLNRLFDTLGVPLETAVQHAAGDTLAEQTGWTAGKHEQEGPRSDDGERLAIASRVLMLKEVPAAEAHARRLLEDVPSRGGPQRRLLREAAGFVPYWMDTIRRRKARRLFVHWTVERLLADGVDDAVDAACKATFGFVQASTVGNTALAGHMAFLALRAGVSVEDLLAARDGDDDIDDPAGAVMAFARATSGGATTLDDDLVDALLVHGSAAGLVELVTLAAVLTAMHRYTASVPPVQPEPEIEALLVEHGDALGLTGATT